MQDLVSDNSEIIAAVSKYDVNLLKIASFAFRDNIHIAKAALQGNHEFLKYITDNLKDSYDLFSFAVE